MEPNTLTPLTASEIGALLAFASDDDARVNLYGIGWSVIDGIERIFATDGHRLLLRSVETDAGDVSPFLIPVPLARAFQGYAAATKGGVTVKHDGTMLHAELGPGTFSFKPEATPPPVQGIIAETAGWGDVAMSCLAFNPALFSDLEILGNIGRCWLASIPPEPLGPIRLDLGGTPLWTALVMPMRPMRIRYGAAGLPENLAARAYAVYGSAE